MEITFDNVVGTIKFFLKRELLKGRLSAPAFIRMSHTALIKIRKGGHVYIGRCSSLSSHSVISATENAIIEIGTNTGVNYGSVIVAREKIFIGSNVMIGPHVAIYDHSHIFNKCGITMRKAGYKTAPVIIEDNVWIGANTVILKGVRIGTGSVIGAGCVVSKSIPQNSLVTSNRELNISEIKR